MTATQTKRIAAGNFELIDKATGKALGRFGGRDGWKWAQLMDGTMITEDSVVSVAGIKRLIVYAAEAAAKP